MTKNWSLQLQLKINTYKIKKEKKGKENKTEQNKEQLKWKVEQGILCSQ